MELVWGSLARPPNGPRSSRPMATAASLSLARRAARDRHPPPLTGVGPEASKPRERPTRTRSARDARKTLTKRVRGVSRNPLRTPGPAPPKAHESLISRKTVAEVPLTGLSLDTLGPGDGSGILAGALGFRRSFAAGIPSGGPGDRSGTEPPDADHGSSRPRTCGAVTDPVLKHGSKSSLKMVALNGPSDQFAPCYHRLRQTNSLLHGRLP